MSIDLQFDIENHVVIRTVQKGTRFEDIAAAVDEHLDDPRFVKGMSVLWDYRPITGFKVPTEKIVEGASGTASYAEKRGLGGMALVMGSTFNFGLGRMFELMAGDSPYPIRVFKDYDEAFKWCCATQRVTQP